MARGESSDELVSRITVEVERLVETGRGPSALVDSLLKEGAPELAALAAERHHHATMVRLEDAQRRMLAEKSPVLRIDEKILVAAPVGFMEREGLSRFLDRVLAAVASHRPARVVLAMQGFEPHEGAEEQLAAFEEELVALGVSSELR